MQGETKMVKMPGMISIGELVVDIIPKVNLAKKLQREGFILAGTVNATEDGVVEIPASLMLPNTIETRVVDNALLPYADIKPGTQYVIYCKQR